MRPMILPVIHYADDVQALRNAERAFDAGCEGVMLIEMRGRNLDLPHAAWQIKNRWPDRLVGLNFLNAQPDELPIKYGLDAVWTDEQLTHTDNAKSLVARRISRDMLMMMSPPLLFCAVAFKYQQHEPFPAIAAARAVKMGFIPTTSGPATGQPADAVAVENMRADMALDAPLALASGITPENAHLYLPLLSHALVSTGVSSSFHEFDPARLRALMDARQ